MHIRKIDTFNRHDVVRFVEFPNLLYRHCPQWVPWPIADGLQQLDRKGAYFKHSDADFFVAEEGDRMLGRICVMENRHYNDYHHARHAFFYLFDTVDDAAVAGNLFDAAFEWSKARGLTRMIGPKGFVPFDGIGMLNKGFEYRPAMGLPYNYEYYNRLAEQLGFEKEVDFTSMYLESRDFTLPERVIRVAEWVKQRHDLRVKTFSSAAEVRRWIPAIVETYNRVFVNNWEYVPVTEEEAAELTKRMLPIVQPRQIKLVINNQDEIVGFLLTFLDITEALQRTGGKMFPFGWLTLLLALWRTRLVNINGMGILEEYRGLGGNAIMYTELYQTLQARGIERGEMIQMADTAEAMLADMATMGARPLKVHRVYHRDI